MKKTFVLTCLLFSIVGCQDDAWNNKKDKKEYEENDYLTVSEFKEQDSESIGYHRISINANARGDNHEAFMFINVKREDNFCDDINETITTTGNKEFIWKLCDGYNSARVSFWIIKNSKRIDLDDIFIEKTVE